MSTVINGPMRLWMTKREWRSQQSVTPAPLPVLRENDTDGRMAVALRSRDFVPNDHGVSTIKRTIPYLDRDDYLRQERWDAHKIPHKTPLIPTASLAPGCAQTTINVP